jgi:hypothetical protein
MSSRNIILLLIIATIYIGCNSGSSGKNTTENVGFVATIDTTMTLMEVAKANNIGEPYLRTKLGIPAKIGKKYTVTEMTRRFNFSIEDLKNTIEDRKNLQNSRKRKSPEKNDK